MTEHALTHPKNKITHKKCHGAAAHGSPCFYHVEEQPGLGHQQGVLILVLILVLISLVARGGTPRLVSSSGSPF